MLTCCRSARPPSQTIGYMHSRGTSTVEPLSGRPKKRTACQVRDLEDLMQLVRDRRTRPLVADSVKAYGAGALRSALVSLWIAVLADLILKVRHLADTGDGKASEAIKKLDKAIEDQNVPSMQEFERGVLNLVSKELDILSDREVVELTRLYQDRNRCAHPAFVAVGEDLWHPTPELVRAHLAASVDAVFSQRPIAGKRLLDVLVRELQSDAWPSAADSTIREYLSERYFAHTRQSVRENLMRLLIKSSIRPPEDDQRVASRCNRAVRVLAVSEPMLYQPALDNVLHNWERAGALTDDDVKRAVAAFGESVAFWEALPRTARARLLGMLSEQEPDRLVEVPAFTSGGCADEEVALALKEAARRLSFDQLREIIETSGGSELLVPASLHFVSESGSYREAEGRLRVLHKCAASLQPEDVRALHQCIRNNPHDQLRLAGGTENILIAIYEDSPHTPEHDTAWHELASYLKEEGERRPNSAFRYESFREAVGLEVRTNGQEVAPTSTDE